MLSKINSVGFGYGPGQPVITITPPFSVQCPLGMVMQSVGPNPSFLLGQLQGMFVDMVDGLDLRDCVLVSRVAVTIRAVNYEPVDSEHPEVLPLIEELVARINERLQQENKVLVEFQNTARPPYSYIVESLQPGLFVV